MTEQQIEQASLPSDQNRAPLSGVCAGRFALTRVDAKFLQRLLPPALELAPNPYTQAGQHPLLLMFNKVNLQTNDNLERIANEYDFGLNLNYNEFIAVIPYVQFKDASRGRIPYCFLPVLFLDSLLAVIGGRLFWEFNKRMSRFDITVGRYAVKRVISGTLLFSSTNTMDGDPILGSSLPNFVAITPILDLPVIEYGILGYVSCIYKIEYQNQYITPSSIQLNNHSCEYLLPGSLAVPSIRQNVMGCFDMTYNWELSFIKFHPNE